jgi:chain length determinant protein tyrosine kinase EpsG
MLNTKSNASSSNHEANQGVKHSPIGSLLIELGKLTAADEERILKVQQEKGMRFGDAALSLGLITESDISQVLSMQFNYPYLQAGKGNYSDKLVAAYQPFTPQVESLRTLRSQLMKRWFSDGNKALAVVSVNAGEGASHLIANLAILCSQLALRTLLVDANLRDPRQHELFSLSEKRGLSDILAARQDISLVSAIEAFPNLSLLGAGTLAPNPQELLNRATFADLMNQAMAQFDVILVDTSPAAMSADSQAIVALCGGALLVSRLNHTRLADLAAVKAQISLTGAQIVGAVINEF